MRSHGMLNTYVRVARLHTQPPCSLTLALCAEFKNQNCVNGLPLLLGADEAAIAVQEGAAPPALCPLLPPHESQACLPVPAPVQPLVT